MAGFCANSPNGSPGARASTVNRMTLIPRMLGIISRMRRMTYWRDTRYSAAPRRAERFSRQRQREGAAGAAPSRPSESRSRLLVPVLNVPGIVVPAADFGDQLGAHRGHAGARHDRDHDVV